LEEVFKEQRENAFDSVPNNSGQVRKNHSEEAENLL
jgi:hypothetical protein